MEATPNLYVVATPVGNLADMVPRAIEVLQTVDVIAAEDTRRSRPLLKHFGIDTRLVAYHDHSDGATVEKLLDQLREGRSIALISDAGTPLISDPGFRLVDAVLAAGFRVVPVPGACAMVAALSVAGLPSDRFVFEGFLPAKQGARVAALSALEKETRTLIFYEAPHRLLESLRDISSVMGADRVVVLARELTKLYETVVRKPAAELAEWVAADADQQRGECVVLVAGYRDVRDESLPEEGVKVLKILCDELPLKQACALAAQITGIKKNRLYQYALDELK